MRIIGNNPAAENAEITAVASGTMADGKTVVVNADGTVSVVAETSVSQTLGATDTFHSGAPAKDITAVKDPSTNKIIVVYVNGSTMNYVIGTISGTDMTFTSPVFIESTVNQGCAAAFDVNAGRIVIINNGESNSGYVRVGTVSATSISFGSRVTFDASESTEMSAVYDPDAQKVIIAYRDSGSSERGTAIVATVDPSDNSISLGSGTQFETGATADTDIAYDTVNNVVIIAYRDAGNSNYGTAVAGTVSGTSITFGSPVVFNSAITPGPSIAVDTSANKFVIAYEDRGTSPDKGVAIVGTVSGTSLSFGTEVVYHNNDNRLNSASYHEEAGKIVIAYCDASDADKGFFIVGTVSGSSISFGTAVEYNNQDATYNEVIYDPTTKQNVVFYQDYNGSSGAANGQSNVFTPAYSSTNITAENFIGFANGAAADGGTARVQIGSGINGAQSSLTAGQQYFVQLDGTIGLTAADPSVIAGTAISATEIIVKG